MLKQRPKGTGEKHPCNLFATLTLTLPAAIRHRGPAMGHPASFTYLQCPAEAGSLFFFFSYISQLLFESVSPAFYLLLLTRGR